MAIKKAEDIFGKYILVKLRYYDSNGVFLEKKEIHGQIIGYDERRWIQIQLCGAHAGETISIPPELHSIREAAAGEYWLESTREMVINPDLETTWTITKPQMH